MSCCAVLFAAYAILLILLRKNAQPEERICWFQKKNRAGEECRGPMRRLNEGTARFVGGNLNCWACSRHLMRATREANAFCSCPLQEHSSELSRKKIPKRFYRLFDRIGTNIPNYRPGARWCNKCATIADTVFSQEPEYNPPPKVRMFYLVYILFQFETIHTNKHQ